MAFLAHEPEAPAPQKAPFISRRTLVIGVPALVGLAAAGAVTGYVLAGDGPKDEGAAGTPSPSPGAFPTDTMLVRLDEGERSAIYSTTPGSGKRTQLVAGGYDVLPQWSHKRDLITYIRRITPTHWQIFTMGKDGSGAELIVDKVNRGTRVCWSPDDTKLAYVARVSGRNQLFTVPSTGGTPTQVTRTNDDKDDPAWAPNVQGLVCMWGVRDGKPQLMLFRLDDPDGSRQWLTSGGLASVDPDFSPDGKLIAYSHSKVSGQADIWVVTPDGKSSPVTSGPDLDMDPTWSPDGRWIAFTRGPVAKPRIYAVRPDGTGLRELTAGTALEGHASWS
ncbi:TolB family protein [Micromonospora sp. CPCC 206061]|uniref:TolB family protein n=1 Tax=Micromonospora sp. CPCC 206061 TaxID=3122410 RepID=UPI002FF00C02